MYNLNNLKSNQNKLNATGLHIPTIAEIYEPVLKELEENGIRFSETVKPIA